MLSRNAGGCRKALSRSARNLRVLWESVVWARARPFGNRAPRGSGARLQRLHRVAIEDTRLPKLGDDVCATKGTAYVKRKYEADPCRMMA